MHKVLKLNQSFEIENNLVHQIPRLKFIYCLLPNPPNFLLPSMCTFKRRFFFNALSIYRVAALFPENTFKASLWHSNLSFKMIFLDELPHNQKQTPHSKNGESTEGFKSSDSLQALHRTDPSSFSPMRKTSHRFSKWPEKCDETELWIVISSNFAHHGDRPQRRVKRGQRHATPHLHKGPQGEQWRVYKYFGDKTMDGLVIRKPTLHLTGGRHPR